ncbi:MAG: hypothetical protein QXT73_07680, partial [Candidatus Methanomethylicaceae archaeon]
MSPRGHNNWTTKPHILIPISLSNARRPLAKNQPVGDPQPQWIFQIFGYNQTAGVETLKVEYRDIGYDTTPHQWLTYRKFYSYWRPWGAKVTARIKKIVIRNASKLDWKDNNDNVYFNVSHIQPTIVGFIHINEIMDQNHNIEISTTQGEYTKLDINEIHNTNQYVYKTVDFDSIWAENQWVRRPGETTETSANHSATITTKYIKIWKLLQKKWDGMSKKNYKFSNRFYIGTNNDINKEDNVFLYLFMHFRPN